MSDERLRLLAELKDNMSGQLRKINKELKETKRTPGMEQAQKWFTGFNQTAKEFQAVGAGVSGVMGSIGVGGLTAAASLAVLTRQFKELGDHVFTMKRLGQETGMTIDQVKRWEYVGQIFHVPVEQMDAALKELGDKMADFRRHRGDLFGQLNQQAPEEVTKLLGLKDADAQFHEILRWLGTIKDVSVRNRWSKEFFGTDDIDALLTNGMPALEKALANAKSKVAPITPDMQKQADALTGSIVDLNQAWENFELKIGPAFLGTLTGILDATTSAFHRIADDPTYKEAKKAQQEYDDAQKQAATPAPPAQSNAAPMKRGDHLFKKSSYDGSGFGNLLQHAAFIEGGATKGAGFGLEGTIAGGTKIGVLAAFREWAAEGSASGGGGAGGGGGFTRASYETGGGGGGGGGRGGAGGGFDGDVPLGSKAGDLTKLIDQEAKRAGVAPRVMEGIRAGESLHRNSYDKKDDALESSWGPFQLNRRRGLGVQFEHDTGLDLRSPSSIAAQARWVAQYLHRGGSLRAWSGFHGPRDADPRWGNSGYSANPDAGEKTNPNGTPSARDAGMQLRTLNEQCVSLAKAAVGASGTVREWHKGVGALEGTLRPGTPIATFLDRHGRETDRYAGGGVGTPGAHLDHAGVFQSYIRDKDGKIIGMNMAEQFAGSHGIHSRAYFNKGWGEGNASNYHAIMGGDGGYLGDGRNPMSQAIGSLADEARKAREQSADRSRDGSVEAHVHIHDGIVRGATAKSSGIIGTTRVHLRRGPTMTEPNISA